MQWLYYIEERSVGLLVEGKPTEHPCFVKIGVSDNPELRLTQLQTCNPRPLKLVSVRPIPSEINRTDYEKEVHKELVDARQTGEWFTTTQKVLDWRKKNMLDIPIEEQLNKSVVDYLLLLGAQQGKLSVFDTLSKNAKDPSTCKHEHMRWQIVHFLRKDSIQVGETISCDICEFHWNKEYKKPKSIFGTADDVEDACDSKWEEPNLERWQQGLRFYELASFKEKTLSVMTSEKVKEGESFR